MNLRSLAVSLLAVLAASAPAAAAKMLHYKGRITAHPPGKLHIQVDDGSTGDWTLDEKAVATQGRKRVALNELHDGDEVSLAVSEDGVIHQVKVLRAAGAAGAKAAPKTAGYWATQKGKGKWWSGEVYELNEAAQELGLRRQGSPATARFKADAKTLVYVQEAGGKKRKASFSAVRKGARAEAYAMDGRTTQIIVLP